MRQAIRDKLIKVEAKANQSLSTLSDAENTPVVLSPGRERQLAALRKHGWKPGQSGNPGGRPAKPLSDRVLRELMTRRGQRIHKVADAIIAKAETGDVPAFVAIRDTVEGKPVQRVEGQQDIVITIERVGE